MYYFLKWNNSAVIWNDYFIRHEANRIYNSAATDISHKWGLVSSLAEKAPGSFGRPSLRRVRLCDEGSS